MSQAQTALTSSTLFPRLLSRAIFTWDVGKAQEDHVTRFLWIFPVLREEDAGIRTASVWLSEDIHSISFCHTCPERALSTRPSRRYQRRKLFKVKNSNYPFIFLKKYHLKTFKHLSKILFRNIVLFGINGCVELTRSTEVSDSQILASALYYARP